MQTQRFTQLPGIALAVMLTLTGVGVLGFGTEARAEGGRKLEGTWLIETTLVNCATGDPLPITGNPFPTVHTYLRGKDLAMFAWTPPQLPDPRNLVCTSRFTLADGTLLPEFDRFGLFPWEEALSCVGKNLARILGSIRPAAGWG